MINEITAPTRPAMLQIRPASAFPENLPSRLDMHAITMPMILRTGAMNGQQHQPVTHEAMPRIKAAVS